MARALGLVFSVLLVACCLACGGADVGPAKSVEVGDPVKWLDSPGTLSDTYGPLAQVDLGSIKMWVPVEDVTPSPPVLEVPASDTCSVTKGDPIPMGTNTFVVTTIHGSMAEVKLDDSALWEPCDDLAALVAARAKPKPKPRSAPRPGPDPRAAAISRCKSGCNKQCRGAKNKSKCVGQCRRACAK